MILNSVFRVMIVILLSVVVNVVVVFYIISYVQSEDKPVKVPYLVGMDILEAANQIEKLNQTLENKIQIKISSILSDQHLKYTVTQQEPNPKKMPIKEGRTITLKVSKGNPNPKIHNYINKPFKLVHQKFYSKKLYEKSYITKMKQEIKTILNQKRKKAIVKIKLIKQILKKKLSLTSSRSLLTIGSVIFAYHPKVPAGIVIDQNPKPGAMHTENTRINFVVSLGNQKNYLLVENYVNKHVEQVTKALEEKNILTKIKTIYRKNRLKDGLIVSQSVKPRNKLFPGDKITFEVANFSSDKLSLNRYRKIKFIVPTSILHKINMKTKSNKKVKVKLSVKDNLGETVVYEGYKKPGAKIVEFIKVSGKGIVYAFINGKLYKRFKLK